MHKMLKVISPSIVRHVHSAVYIIQANVSSLGHKKLIFCFSGTFLKKRMRGGAIFFYCVRLFFSCFPVDSIVKDCVIAYTLPFITIFFENRKKKYSSNV